MVASFKMDILYYVSRIEKVLNENDALAKTFVENTSKMSKDVDAIKQLINTMSESENPDDHSFQIPGIRILEKRVRANACSQVETSRKNSLTVDDDNHIEGLSR